MTPPPPHDAAAFAQNPLTTGVALYFHHAGPYSVLLSHKPQMLESSLVRRSGAAVLIGCYLTGMRPHDGKFTVPEVFVTSGVHIISVTGLAGLES